MTELPADTDDLATLILARSDYQSRAQQDAAADPVELTSTHSKDKYDAGFNVDWAITYDGKLIALEEDKGHYVDSCFQERALSGFIKTVNTYLKKNKTVPVLILHSFTRYKKFNEKLEEDMDTRKEEIQAEIRKQLV